MSQQEVIWESTHLWRGGRSVFAMTGMYSTELSELLELAARRFAALAILDREWC